MKSIKEHDATTQRLLEGLFQQQWSAGAWTASAGVSYRAAEILFASYNSSRSDEGEPLEPEDLEMNQPATLLLGYAVENAIKGYLIQKLSLSPQKCNGDKAWSGHNLSALFARTGLEATKEQLLLLKTLTAFVLWAGKYPASFDCSGERGFLLPEQYDGPYVCKNMPPTAFDYSMRYQIAELFQNVLSETRALNKRT